uniref:Expressed conserved protein n=1 Tax=Syphacia muris TaxID=451379 RepID=A0A0N5APH5_9BILA
MLRSGETQTHRGPTSPYVSMDYEGNDEDKTKFFYDERSGRYHCCCGLLHVISGTKMFLLFYIILSVAVLILGIPAAFVWMVLPFIITVLSIYALCTEKHRYLYPFLILSVS